MTLRANEEDKAMSEEAKWLASVRLIHDPANGDDCDVYRILWLVDASDAEVKRLKEALEYYAGFDDYDAGTRARAALEGR